jgi:hypothetical protein
LLLEFGVTRYAGAERVVRARGEATVEHTRGPVKVVGTMQDVTEVAAARRARDLLSYVVQSTGDAIVTKFHDGTITSWNHGAERVRYEERLRQMPTTTSSPACSTGAASTSSSSASSPGPAATPSTTQCSASTSTTSRG